MLSKALILPFDQKKELLVYLQYFLAPIMPALPGRATLHSFCTLVDPLLLHGESPGDCPPMPPLGRPSVTPDFCGSLVTPCSRALNIQKKSLGSNLEKAAILPISPKSVEYSSGTNFV